MKHLSILVLAAIGLAGCVAVPVAEPPGAYAGVYVTPPPVFVGRPHYYGYYGHRRHWH